MNENNSETLLGQQEGETNRKPTTTTNKTLFIDKYKPKSLEEFCLFNPRLFKVLDMIFPVFNTDSSPPPPEPPSLREFKNNDSTNQFPINLLFVGEHSCGKSLLLNLLLQRYYYCNVRTPSTPPVPVTAADTFGISSFSSVLKNEVLFLNNLKEQGMQFYRNELKMFCHSHCSIPGKKKIVVIDDMDTISIQGQHVFRNYIDKYSSHVIFLTVCNDLQKIIESLQSRLCIIKIEPPPPQQLRYILDTVCDKEQFQLKENAKEFILKYSNRSVRNLIGYLEKIYLYHMHLEGVVVEEKRNYLRDISLQFCKSMCSDIKIDDFENYLYFLKHDKLSKAIDIMYDLYDNGFSVIDIYELLFIFIKYNGEEEKDNNECGGGEKRKKSMGKLCILTETEKHDIFKLLCYYMYIFYNSHENVIELVIFTNELAKILKKHNN